MIIDVVWVLVAVAFWGPSFENVTERTTVFETREQCTRKQTELIELASGLSLPATVVCLPVENPAAKK